MLAGLFVVTLAALAGQGRAGADCREKPSELGAVLSGVGGNPEAYLLGHAPEGPRRRQARRIAGAFDKLLQVDVRCVPVVVLDPPQLLAVYRQIGGQIGHRFELQGFHARGHIFLRRKLGTVSDAVLVHELLHAMSRRFTDEAMGRGYRNLVEGITEYFAIAMLTRHLGWRDVPKVYGGYVSFAEALVVRLREPHVRQAYLDDGFAWLVARADDVMGADTFLKALSLLERKEFGPAISLVLGISDRESP